MCTSAEFVEGFFVGSNLYVYLEDGSDENWEEGKDHIVESDGPW